MKNMVQWWKHCLLYLVMVSGIFKNLTRNNIFWHTFNTVVDQSLGHLHLLELIDQPSENHMKSLRSNNLVSFYTKYVRGKFGNLTEHALKIITF